MEKLEEIFECFVKVVFCLEGRDKVSKLIQYSSRMTAYYLLENDPENSLGHKSRALYKAMQQARKGFRLGKSLNEYHKARKLFHDKTIDPFQKYLNFIKHACLFMYMFYDNQVFFRRAKVLQLNADKASARGGTFWFTANAIGFYLALTNLLKDAKEETRLQRQLSHEANHAPEDAQDAQFHLAKLRRTRAKKLCLLIKFTSDLIVSSNTASIRLSSRLVGRKLNDGVIGACGSISALSVLYNIWPKSK